MKMKKLIIAITLTSAFAINGFTQEGEVDKAQQAEAERLCKIYTEKAEKYKASMRDDEMAQATLDNYIRIRDINCEKVKKHN
jgi:hypothetical protein